MLNFLYLFMLRMLRMYFMWLLFAILGAVSTSLTTIFAKVGIKNVKSNFATSYRTLIVIVCSIAMCLIYGSIKEINTLTKENWIFLVLSGIATGCSWLCYYKALKLSNVNKVVPIDKSSFILTSILFVIFFFNDTTSNGDILTIFMLVLSNLLMLFGTILMIQKNKDTEIKSKSWLIYAILSAVFASIVSLFIKIGLQGMSSSLGTLIRSIIVFMFALIITVCKKEYKTISSVTKKDYLFLTLSGLATGCAWLFEYDALNTAGVNPVAVNSISKLSILLTMLFSFLFLKEKFSKKSLIGLSLLVLGIVIIIIFNL